MKSLTITHSLWRLFQGDQIHWLACALYVACRNSTLPTVGQAGATIQGNGVSLARLLRSSKLSLIEFFNKAQKWADMSNVKSEYREKIDLLQRNFSVSNVIFKKYQLIFIGLFKDPADDPPKVKIWKKISSNHKSHQISFSERCEFAIFIYNKKISRKSPNK